jgi:PKHD-type hydroxylase
MRISALHRVEPVTAGERLAIVGWMASWVKSPTEREILYDLDRGARTIFETQGKTPVFDRVLKCQKQTLSYVGCRLMGLF